MQRSHRRALGCVHCLDAKIQGKNMDLIEISRSGDRDAFGLIVKQYQGLVSGVIYGIVGDFHKSEDIAQETFLVAWKKLGELRDASKLSAWLCGIAANIAKKSLKKGAKISVVSVVDSGDILDSADDPAKKLARHEQNLLIWKALERIPEKYRIPLVLYYRSENSIPEIAAALALSEDVIYMRLTRARKYLRKELEKQVECAISSSGPGDFFSIAVVASLPALALPEKAIAATAIVAAPKPGPTSATLFGASFFGGIVSSVLIWNTTASLAYLFLILAAVPGVWFSVRNAPTLRIRRYLILCSLRAHLLIAFACFVVWVLFPTCQVIIQLLKYCGVQIGYETELAYIINPLSFGCGGILWIGAGFLAIVSPLVYRRILREDCGLVSPKTNVPLEESSLSLARLQNTFRRFSTTCWVMLLWYVVLFFIRIALRATEIFKGEFVFVLEVGNDGILFGLLLVGIIYYYVFRKLHRRLLETAKDAATFEIVGPVWDRGKTPLVERIFVEWLVYLGCFIAVGVIVSVKPAIDYDWIPYYPIPLTKKLALIIFVSVILAAINAVFPRLRWLFVLGGAMLVGFGIDIIYRSNDHARNASFLDSPGNWPHIFGIIFMNIFVAYAIFATLIIGWSHYRSKWGGKTIRISLPKKIAICCGVFAVLLLCVAPMCYSSLRVQYWSLRSILVRNLDKQLELCNEVIRLTPPDKSDSDFYGALARRGNIYFCMEQYEKATVDFDAYIEYYNTTKKENKNLRYKAVGTYENKGHIKFVTGDLVDAVAAYTEALKISERNCTALYNRGFAYEKLGETEKAVADYTAAIELFEENEHTWMHYVDSLVPRPGYDDENHRSPNMENGYRISLDELIEITRRLAQEL